MKGLGVVHLSGASPYNTLLSTPRVLKPYYCLISRFALSRYNRITYQQGFGFPHCCHALASRDMAEKQKELKTSTTKRVEVLAGQFEYSARKHFQRRLSYENPYQRDVHDWAKYDTVYRVWYCLAVYLSVRLSDIFWYFLATTIIYSLPTLNTSQISTYYQVNAALSEATCDSVGKRFFDTHSVVQTSGW